MGTGATERLARFIAETNYGNIPGEAVRIAKRAILDWVGVTLGGFNEPSARIVSEQVKRMKAVGESGVICKAFQTSADLAAWVNGTASHALDYDDTFANEAGFNFHPTVTLLSAVLALGEKVKASGREILAAYIVGIEAETRIGAAMGRINSETGWHPTPVVGTIGAVAASANILRLNVDQTLMALGTACSLAGGLLQNFGTMTKPLHAGNSARNGVVAALLAQNGFTGNESIMEGNLGFCSMFSAGKVSGMEDKEEGLGKTWRIVTPGMSTKPYPCCRSTHSSIDASLHLRNVQGVDAGEIVKILCKTSPQHTRLARFHKPKSAYEGKFSIPYCIAAALLRGKILLEDFTEEKVADREAQALLSKVEFQYPQEYKENPMALTGEVAVTLANGAEYSRKIDVPKGDASNPMTDEELSEKFQDCAQLVLHQAEIEKVLGILQSLESLTDIAELMNVITYKTKSSERGR
jgi:2-methylcitrate dehydratase PrpD